MNPSSSSKGRPSRRTCRSNVSLYLSASREVKNAPMSPFSGVKMCEKTSLLSTFSEMSFLRAAMLAAASASFSQYVELIPVSGRTPMNKKEVVLRVHSILMLQTRRSSSEFTVKLPQHHRASRITLQGHRSQLVQR